MILACTVLIGLKGVMDRETDGQTDTWTMANYLHWGKFLSISYIKFVLAVLHPTGSLGRERNGREERR